MTPDLRSPLDRATDRIEALTAERDAAVAEVAALRAALTPSADTKAAYVGEFKTQHPDRDEAPVTVDWTATKQIMAAISHHAAVIARALEVPDV